MKLHFTIPKRFGVAFLCFSIAISTACSLHQKNHITDKKNLKEVYKEYFNIGVAVNTKNIKGDEGEHILKHFNSITPENAMKMGPIHPLENQFFWEDADEIVDFALHNGLKIRGHNLCWHEQTPEWIFVDDQGNDVSKEVLLKRLENHIKTVVGRYKGKIYVWDVVNEAIDDDPRNQLRNSKWFQICGEDFIAKAFEYAHAADPDALLFYNDYNSELPEKRDRIYQLLKRLIDQDVPIHGVGLQGHWSLEQPTESELREAINQFSSLGLKLEFTELDMSIYPWEKERRELRANEADDFTAELEKKQAERYAMVFKVFRENKDAITNITFWNVSDRHSWLDSYPVRGRKNYPLLFNEQLQPKKAYWKVINFKD